MEKNVVDVNGRKYFRPPQTEENAPSSCGADCSLQAVAEAIVDDLLDGGRRLAIESHKTRLPARGWGRQPMIDRVLKHLEANARLDRTEVAEQE